MRSQFGDDGSGPEVAQVVAQVHQSVQGTFKRLGPVFGLVLAAVLGWAAFYQVGPGEQAVIRTFGRESGRAGPGAHFLIPLVQQVDKVNVEQIRSVEVGVRKGERVSSEAEMITADENIVEAQLIVQYRVTDPSKYLFRLNDSETSLRDTAEVALRSQVGKTSIDDVLTTSRELVQDQTRAFLQQLLDNYQSGLTVTEVKLQVVDAPDAVKDAFHDVVRAREEKEKLINQAKGYYADQIPKARGEAQSILRDAEAYSEQRKLRAQGDAERFGSVYAEYDRARKVTRERLYLETMERIMGKVERKVIVDQQVSKGAVSVLPLGGAVTVAGGKP